MRAIIIDSDKQVLNSLEKKIYNLSKIQVVGKYMNPHAGLIGVVQIKPDLVFLEVDNNGIEIAKELVTAFPDIQLVLMAKSEKYAVQAFELQVRDYILKPITESRLIKTINKIKGSSVIGDMRQSMIRCFKRLDFVNITDGVDSIDVKWRTAKSKEIFAYLLHHRYIEVRKDTLTQMHWPISGKKEAYAQLYTAIYHIRKTIKSTKLPIEIINSNVGYELKTNNVLIDVEEFKNKISENLTISKENIHEHRKTLDIYRGDYLEVEDYSWAKNEQSKLHFLYVNYSKKIADFYMNQENYNEAILMFIQLQKKLPFQEDYYFELMKLFLKIGDFDTVRFYYQKMMSMMKRVKKTPREEIQLWYKSNII